MRTATRGMGLATPGGAPAYYESNIIAHFVPHSPFHCAVLYAPRRDRSSDIRVLRCCRQPRIPAPRPSRNPMNNADLIVATLKAAGIRHGFGIPSGNVLPLMEAMRKGGVEFVLTAHEGSAGFAADVSGRLTGAPGLAIATLGPRRHQSRDRRRLGLARPLADDRHHLQSQHRPARPPHPDVDRPPRAVQADHQGDAAAGARAHRGDRERRHRARHERADGAGASRPAGGRRARAGDRSSPAAGRAASRSRRRRTPRSRAPAS